MHQDVAPFGYPDDHLCSSIIRKLLTCRIIVCYNDPRISAKNREKPLIKPPSSLRLNVGFLLKEGVGYTRDIPFEEPTILLADDLTARELQGSVNFTRTPQGLYAQGQISGHITLDCTRCLTPVENTLKSRITELFYYPPDEAPEGILPIGDDLNVDLTPIVREDMLVAIPIRVLCRPDCKGLCPTCGKNWNDGPCDCKDDDRDPRFAVLTELLKNRKDD